LAEAAGDLGNDLSDYDAEDAAAVFPLAAVLRRHSSWTYHLDTWMSEHAPAGWVDSHGNITPSEVLDLHRDAHNGAECHLSIRLSQLDDGWRAAARHSMYGVGYEP